MKVFVIFLVLIGIVTFSTIPFIYAPPEPMPDDDFRFSDHVLTGKVISSEVIPDPRKNTPQVTYRDTVVYEIKVIEWHKNPLNNSTITVYGKHFPNDVVPEPMWGIVEFEIGSTVYLYLDETEDGLKFREYASHRVETSENDSKYPVPGGGIISDIYPVKKQFEMGLKFENLKCNEGHVLIQKYDGSPACVERGTHWKLIERDWAKTDSATKSIIQKAKSLRISNTMDAIDSRELSIEEKEQYVHAKYTISHDESPTLNIRIKDLPRTLEYGEMPTFTIIETGYAEPCTSPKLQVYHLKQEIGNDHTDDDLVYEDQLVYRCPSIKEMDAILNIWDDSRFKPMPVCEEEGRFLIVGDSGYERGALESYTCIGK